MSRDLTAFRTPPQITLFLELLRDILIGFSVIVRYGHLASLEPSTFVGNPVSARQKLGTIGRYEPSDLHLHLEIFNFTEPIQPGVFYSVNGSANLYGILDNIELPLEQRNVDRYDIVQFFAQTGVSDVAGTAVQNMVYQTTNGDLIKIGSVCDLTFRVSTQTSVADTNYSPMGSPSTLTRIEKTTSIFACQTKIRSGEV